VDAERDTQHHKAAAFFTVGSWWSVSGGIRVEADVRLGTRDYGT
jgi:hypothetical protein